MSLIDRISSVTPPVDFLLVANSPGRGSQLTVVTLGSLVESLESLPTLLAVHCSTIEACAETRRSLHDLSAYHLSCVSVGV